MSEIPKDLTPIIWAALRVPRYGDMRLGLENQFYTTGSHMISGSTRILDLPDSYIDEASRQLATRMFILDDGPEAFTQLGDVTAIKKERDSQLARRVRVTELEAARANYSEADFELYQQTGMAKQILTGQMPVDEARKIRPEAFLAKVIDLVDGSEPCHLHWGYRYANERFTVQTPEEYLTFSLRKFFIYRESLLKTPLPDNIKILCLDQLYQMANWVEKQWSEVPRNKIPPNFSKLLEQSRDEYLLYSHILQPVDLRRS